MGVYIQTHHPDIVRKQYKIKRFEFHYLRKVRTCFGLGFSKMGFDPGHRGVKQRAVAIGQGAKFTTVPDSHNSFAICGWFVVADVDQ